MADICPEYLMSSCAEFTDKYSGQFLTNQKSWQSGSCQFLPLSTCDFLDVYFLSVLSLSCLWHFFLPPMPRKKITLVGQFIGLVEYSLGLDHLLSIYLFSLSVKTTYHLDIIDRRKYMFWWWQEKFLKVTIVSLKVFLFCGTYSQKNVFLMTIILTCSSLGLIVIFPAYLYKLCLILLTLTAFTTNSFSNTLPWVAHKLCIWWTGVKKQKKSQFCL